MIINKNIINKIEIKKSNFYVFLFNLEDENQVKLELLNIKKNYKGANHYCYAYIINNKEKCSDDGEPSGTAGLPILNILKYEQLENTLCVVVRYFGGIKLGASGLIRAYASVTKETINLIEKLENIKYITTSVTFDYNKIKEYDFLLKKYIINKNYDNLITYELKIPIKEYEKIKKNISIL